MNITPEQKQLIKENLIRYFSIHELADMVIDGWSHETILNNLESLEDK